MSIVKILDSAMAAIDGSYKDALVLCYLAICFEPSFNWWYWLKYHDPMNKLGKPEAVEALCHMFLKDDPNFDWRKFIRKNRVEEYFFGMDEIYHGAF